MLKISENDVFESISELEDEITELNRMNQELNALIIEKQKMIDQYKSEQIKRVPIALDVYPSLASIAESIDSLSKYYKTEMDTLMTSKGSDSRFAVNTMSNLSGIAESIASTSSSIKSLNGSGPRESTYYGIAKAKDDEEVATLEKEIAEIRAKIEANNRTITVIRAQISALLSSGQKNGSVRK